MELIQWKDLSKDYEKELKSGSLATDVFSTNTEKGNKRWADLKNRVAEHVSIISYIKCLKKTIFSFNHKYRFYIFCT